MNDNLNKNKPRRVGDDLPQPTPSSSIVSKSKKSKKNLRGDVPEPTVVPSVSQLKDDVPEPTMIPSTSQLKDDVPEPTMIPSTSQLKDDVPEPTMIPSTSQLKDDVPEPSPAPSIADINMINLNDIEPSPIPYVPTNSSNMNIMNSKMEMIESSYSSENYNTTNTSYSGLLMFSSIGIFAGVMFAYLYKMKKRLLYTPIPEKKEKELNYDFF